MVDTPRLGPPAGPVNRAGEYAEIAAVAGLVLLPWQRHALAVATTLEGERWKHDEVGVVVARQNGKTTMLGARILGGMILDGHNVLHTAQNRALPRPVFDFVGEALTRLLSPDEFTYRRANGQESFTIGDPVPGTGYFPRGSYRILAPKPSAWRGYSADLVLFDEFREHSTSELVDAAGPTMAARANPQVMYTSNAADITGVPLRELRKRGTSGDAGSLAYLEWSADELLSLDDRAGWDQANPALASGVLNERMLSRFLETVPEAAFRTEHLCQFVDAVSDLAYPLDAWRACQDDADLSPSRPVSLAVDIDPDRRTAAAVAAWSVEGRVYVAVVGDWTEPLDDRVVADEVERMRRNLGAQLVEYDPYTALGVADLLGDYAHRVSGPEIIAAGGAVYDAIQARRVAHRGDPYLDAAVASTGKRPVGDGGWRITRKGEHPIPASVAMTLAVYAALHPAPVPAIF